MVRTERSRKSIPVNQLAFEYVRSNLRSVEKLLALLKSLGATVCLERVDVLLSASQRFELCPDILLCTSMAQNLKQEWDGQKCSAWGRRLFTIDHCTYSTHLPETQKDVRSLISVCSTDCWYWLPDFTLLHTSHTVCSLRRAQIRRFNQLTAQLTWR